MVLVREKKDGRGTITIVFECFEKFYVIKRISHLCSFIIIFS